MKERPTKTEGCRRCGTCCRKGGPALHGGDRDLVDGGVIPAACLYTIRAGEPVRDNVRGGVGPAPAEIIKVKGSGGSWACRFLVRGRNTCGIYARRPVECRTLACWDTRAIEAIYDRDRLSRRTLLEGVPGLWELVEAHEERCSYPEVRLLADALRGEDHRAAAGRLVEMIAYDRHLRALVDERIGAEAEWNDFLFGRPLLETVTRFGVRVRREGGKIILSRSPAAGWGKNSAFRGP